jgi:tripartite-type tricarboxylate transporter receptor subunit TctC
MLNSRFHSKHRYIARLQVISCTCLLAVLNFAQAQPYPSRPVRIVVGFPPGGAVDILGRALAQQLSQRFNQQFVVDNRGGASSVIGTDIVAKSLPDGYTLLVVSGAHAVNPGLFVGKLPYNTERDFAPISLIAASSYILVVHPSLQVKSVRELITFAKKNRGLVNYATSGGLPQLSGELFKLMAGVEMTHIPYKGSAAVVTAVLSGEVPIMFTNLISAMPQVKAGRFRALAVTGSKRLASAPDIPTISEAGIPSYEVVGWYGFLAPAATPVDIVMKLSTLTAEVMNSFELQPRLAREGVDPVGSTPDAFSKIIKDDIEKWTEVVRISGAKVD